MFAIQHKESEKCIRSDEYSSSGYSGISFVHPEDMSEGSKVHVFDTLGGAIACMNGSHQETWHDFCKFEIKEYNPDDYQIVCLTTIVM